MSLKPTFYDLVLNDNSVVQVTRNYAGLYMLKAHDPELYEKSQIFNRKATTKDYVADDLETASVIYAAYVTATLVNNSIKKANGDQEDEIMSELDFFTLLPTDAYVLKNIFNKLFGNEKKKANSQKHFREQQNK